MLALAAAGAFGQSQGVVPVVDANVPPPTRWTYHLAFSEVADGVRSAVFAPDRPSIYVHLNMEVFDAWRALVWYWPEVLGAALGVATIAALLIAWRVARRRQVAGAPHCRRCNYDLSPQVERGERGKFRPPADEGARCPECGVLIARARPVRGRRTWVRLSPLAAAWAVLAGGYGAMLIAGVAREGRATYWFDWSSASLAGSIKAHQLGGLAKFIVTGDRVVEVDLRTGKVSRVVTTRRSRTWCEISVTPDGSGLILAGDERGTLQLIGTRTGRRKSAVHLPGPGHPMGSRWRTVVGYSPDGKSAYVQWEGEQSEFSGIGAWDLATNRVVALAQTPGFKRDAYWYSRPFLVRAGSMPAVVSYPSFMEAFPQKSFVLKFHGRDESAPVKEFAVNPVPGPNQDPRVTVDGAAVFVTSQYGDSILRVGLDEPHTVDALSAGARYQFGEWLELSRDNRYLVAGSAMRCLLVRDMQGKRWVGTLDMPSALYGPKPEISADNRWVAAVAQTGDGRGTPFRDELVVWDLRQILSSTSSGGDEPVLSGDSR
jgi:hypothetical protein